MKKSIFLCMASMLLCALLSVSVFAVGGSTVSLATSAEAGTVYAEGEEIEVYLLISPMVKAAGNTPNIKSVARLVGDPSDANKALTTNKNLSSFVSSVTYNADDFIYVGAEYVSTAPTSANAAAQTTDVDAYPVYVFYGAAYSGANVFLPTVTDEDGTVTFDFGTNAAAGFGVNHSATPDYGMIAKLTFRVKSGAVGGNAEFGMTTDYTVAGTAKACTDSLTVSVAAGCAHPEDKRTAIAHDGNRDMTCYQSQIQWYHCDECGNDFFVETPTTIAHNYADELTYVTGEEPTCSVGGHAAKYCQNEGCTVYDPDSYTRVNALGHDLSADRYDYTVASCTETGYSFWCCSRCGVLSKDGQTVNATPYTYFNKDEGTYWSDSAFTASVDVAANPTTYFAVTAAYGHDYVRFTPENAEAGAVYYQCTRCADVLKLEADMLVRYVTTDGTGDGKTQSNPTNMKAAFEHFGTLPADIEATLYLCGKVEMAASSYTADVHVKAFEEAKHVCHVTVTSVNVANKAELFFPFSVCSMYFARGPVTFENIKITSDADGTTAGTSASITIAACGNKLTMGKGLEMPNRTGKNTINASKKDGNVGFAQAVDVDFPNSKIYLIGGYYSTYSGAAPDSYDIDLTVESGTYWLVGGLGRTSQTVLKDSTVNVTFTGKFTTAYFYPTFEANMTNVTVNVRYKAAPTIVFLYRGNPNTYTAANGYTINHLFFAGSSGLVVGDTMMAGKTAHSVHIAYPNGQTTGSAEGAIAKSFYTKGANYPEYLEEQTLTTMAEWCAEYGGGHQYVNGVCTECGLTACASHTESEPILISPATCVEKSVWYTRCTRCFEKLSVFSPENEEPGPHDYQLVIDGNEAYFICSHDGSHISERKSLAGLHTIYVSETGSQIGGFSKEVPQSDFMTALRLAAALDTDVQIVIFGRVHIQAENADIGFIEPAHANHITIGGTDEGMAILDFSYTNRYHLNGDTTFEYVEFTSGSNTDEKTIVAWHNHLTMGEHISMDFMRTASQTAAGSRFNLIGGCHSSKVYGSCTHSDVHLTICSGNYFKIYGGAFAQTACGASSGTITLDFDGDFTVGGGVTGSHGYSQAVLALGGYGVSCGDIVLNVRGNVACRNAFLLGPYGTTTRTAKNITVNIYGGSIIDYSFAITNGGTYPYEDKYASAVLASKVGTVPAPDFKTPGVSTYSAEENGATVYKYRFADATTTIVFPFGSNWEFVAKGVMDTYFESLTVNYDPASASARMLANRFAYTYGIETNAFGSEPCTANPDGMHCAEEAWDHAGYTDIEATCSLAGISYYRCIDCGKIYFEIEEKLEHEYGEDVRIATAATCLSPNVYARTCTVCNHIDLFLSEEDTALGNHKYENNICIYCHAANDCPHDHCGAPETVKDGCSTITVCVCEDCGAQVVLDTVSVPHEFGKYTVTVAATDTTPGIKTRKCKNCGKVETAIIYPNSAFSEEVLVVTEEGSAADFSVNTLKLSKTEKAALNALLQDTAYGSEVKISYTTKGDTVTGVTYSIPVPAEYKDMQNVMIVIKDDNGELHTVAFTIEKGYFVFRY